MRTIYVLRNDRGDALYVGCTGTGVMKRLSSMRSQRPWISEVDMGNVAIFDVEDDQAGVVELAVISLLQPRYNIEGITRRYARPTRTTPKRVPLRPERRFLYEVFVAGLAGAFADECEQAA